MRASKFDIKRYVRVRVHSAFRRKKAQEDPEAVYRSTNLRIREVLEDYGHLLSTWQNSRLRQLHMELADIYNEFSEESRRFWSLQNGVLEKSRQIHIMVDELVDLLEASEIEGLDEGFEV